ncbi:hypothetical protein Tco_0191739 [Tanacetum coccineum]
MPSSLLETSYLQSYEQYLVLQSLGGHVSPPKWCHVACQPSLEPPPDPRSTVVNDSDQRWSTTVNRSGPPVNHNRTTGQPPSDHRSTTIEPPVNHRWTTGQRSGQMVATAATWHATSANWVPVAYVAATSAADAVEGIITFQHRFELGTS